MDKYSTGRVLTQETSFPKCKALMITAGTSGNATLHLYVNGNSGATFAQFFVAKASATQVIPVRCASIGNIFFDSEEIISPTVVVALY